MPPIDIDFKILTPLQLDCLGSEFLISFMEETRMKKLVRKRSNSPYYYTHFRHPVTGVQVSRSTGETENRAARKYAAHLLLELEGEKIDPEIFSQTTFKEAREMYLKSIAPYSASTRNRSNYVGKIFDRYKLNHITEEMIFSRLINKFDTEEQAYNYVSHITAVFKKAKRRKMVDRVLDVDCRQSKAKDLTIWNTEEIKSLREELGKKDITKHIVEPFLFLLSSGWRQNEVQDLTWDRVEMNNDTWVLFEGNQKNGEYERRIVNSHCAALIQKQIGKHHKYVFHNPHTKHGGLGNLFGNTNGAFKKACRRIGINKKPKQLRTTLCTLLDRQGATDPQIMILTGHKDPKSLEHYRAKNEQVAVSISNNAIQSFI